MISEFVREQKRYTRENLKSIFGCSDSDIIRIIRRLKEYGILKTVKNTDEQKNMSDLLQQDIEISDEDKGTNKYLYVFTFVGIIIIEGRVLKCYPKYLFHDNSPTKELKQIIKVLQKYNSKQQIIRMYNEGGKTTTFNRLAVMVYLLNDYHENGLYTNTQDIIEINGAGEICWDKTINDTFAIISDNRPYYVELQTHKRINDDNDYFKRLHECILSVCSKELKDADLLDLLDILGVEISDEIINDFGEDEYILYRLSNEMNVQFNTRKQILLKTMETYIVNKGCLEDVDSFSMFGTNSFNLVWEKVCAEVMDNQLQTPLNALNLPVPLKSEYPKMDLLISLIDKPAWIGYSKDKKEFKKKSNNTLIPDLITIHENQGVYSFVIFDAKYYTIQLEIDKELRGQPGVSDVTKQYLYQLAYKKFVIDHNITNVRNCFLMPTDEDKNIEKGYVEMEILGTLELEHIQIRQLSAMRMYAYYLNNEKFDIDLLNL